MRPIRRSAALLLAAAALAAAGCGGDDEDERTTAAEPPPATTTTAPERNDNLGTSEAEIETETETERERTSPEEQEGGAGDEEPIRSEAVFRGIGGSIRPRVVRVPAFIAIRVELRAEDRGDYTLRIGGKTLRPGDSATLAGLRPGRSYRGSGVSIEATAEPGP